MNKTELENIISYNNHAVTMAQIAVNLLEGKNPLNVRGVRELLALYLLVPYITNKRLDVPAANYNVPQLVTQRKKNNSNLFIKLSCSKCTFKFDRIQVNYLFGVI